MIVPFAIPWNATKPDSRYDGPMDDQQQKSQGLLRMPRAFLIHGYGGWPDEGWRPWLRAELEKRGYEVVAPAMPDTDHPRVVAWVAKLQEVVGEPRPDDVFVGHSLGCITILRFLETLQVGQTVGQAILVAGFFEDLGDDYAEIRSFIDEPVDWDAVKAACQSFSVIHSDDDDAVPVWCARNLAVQLGVPMELTTGYGHFSGGDGITQVPMVLEKII